MTLLAWFSRDTSAEIVELVATPEGVSLYNALGFRRRDVLTMRLNLGAPTEALR
ncbi:MAG: hypothetical protein M3P96_04920 [Actinomycetota bacterium]|nr:hypothetical protein [Actinomycetota bacterium]